MNQQQAQTDQLSIILENILNPNQNIRNEAENEINKLLDLNFGQFLIELSKKLSIESEKKEIRQISSTIIKNMIINSKYTERWFELSEEIKQTIKNNILSTLASKIIEIRKAAALALAGICKIEIPRKIWLNIFDILSGTSQNENLYIQLSSLTALEYIYEEIQKSDIPNNTVAKLLNNYYSLLTKENNDPQLSITTLHSIDKFLPFISDFINDYNSKIKFYQLIERYIMNSNEKIREAALIIFYDISRIYYDSLQDYIDKIYNFTKQIIENDIENNKILSILIWSLIGKEEDHRKNEINYVTKQSHCFLEKYYLSLSEICLKFIVTDNYDSDDYSLSEACSSLIYIMSRACQYNFMEEMMKYIGKNINSTIEKIKYSALLVFRSILGTIHKEKFYIIVKDSLSTISDILIQNYPLHFKKLCSIIMKSITKEFAKEFINDSIYFNKLIELFINLIKVSPNEVIYNIILSINNLCKNIKWTENDQTNILSKNIENIYQPIISISSNINNYNEQYNIPCAGYNLLGTLGERSALDVKNKMIGLFKLLSDMFQSSLNPQNIPNESIRRNYQEYLATCLSGFLTSGRADKQTAANLLQNVITSFQLRNGLYDEAMTLIGSIALFTKEDFSAAMDLISPCLIKGLRSIDSVSLCKSSIFCLSDILSSLGINNKYIKDFLPLIMNILSDDQVDRNLKPHCFNIISDLYMYYPDEAYKYFENIMKIMGAAIQATQIKFDENSEKENITHFIDLREHLIETLTCIFSVMKDNKKAKDFIPYVSGIVKYINTIVQDYANSIEIIKTGLFLLVDFCDCYKKDIKSILNIEIVKHMINKLENDKDESRNENTITGIEWAKNTISEIYY